MFRSFLATAVLLICFANPGSAGEGELVTCLHCDSNVTTLRLYFPPSTIDMDQNPVRFNPEVAKLYVDDHYVGDTIINLHDHMPTLRLPKSTVTLRVEMSDNRKFESKVTLLGHGSTQVLVIDFSKSAANISRRGR